MQCVSTATCDRSGWARRWSLAVVLGALVLVSSTARAEEPTPTTEAAASQPAPDATAPAAPAKKGPSIDARRVLSFVVLEIPWGWMVGSLSVATLLADAVMWANRPEDFGPLKHLPFTITPWGWRAWQATLLGAGLLLGLVAVVLIVLPEIGVVRKLVAGEPPKP